MYFSFLQKRRHSKLISWGSRPGRVFLLILTFNTLIQTERYLVDANSQYCTANATQKNWVSWYEQNATPALRFSTKSTSSPNIPQDILQKISLSIKPPLCSTPLTTTATNHTSRHPPVKLSEYGRLTHFLQTPSLHLFPDTPSHPE